MEFRETCLLDALLQTAARLNIPEVDAELGTLVFSEDLSRIAGWGLRGELVFPVPVVLEANPHLLGYYRLLFGFSQKQFYGSSLGFGRFKAMETEGSLSESCRGQLMPLCTSLCGSGSLLVRNVPRLSKDLVDDLTLLTLGPQLRGSSLNTLGIDATQSVFNLIKSILHKETVSETRSSFTLKNAAGRSIVIAFSADPDISVREERTSGHHHLLAIEIKGGRDHSNIHNRIGEAEKSHQKAKANGFLECWTIVGVDKLNPEKAAQESPTTNSFFLLNDLLDANSSSFHDFQEALRSRIGIRSS